MFNCRIRLFPVRLGTGIVLMFSFFLTAICAENQTSKVHYDCYGQITHKNWPGKVNSDQELMDDISKDNTYYDALSKSLPKRGEYGGIIGSGEKYGLKKTGFFHIEKIKGRDVLVTPAGNMFFMIGIGGIGDYHSFINVKGHEKQFDWLPPKTGKFKRCWKWGKVSFLAANLARKHNGYNPAKYREDCIERVKLFGFNSHYAYGGFNQGISINGKLPMVVVIWNHPKKQIFPGLFDIYDEALRKQMADRIESTVKNNVNEPWLIGYQINNEPKFYEIPDKITKLGANQPAKKAFVELMKRRHGSIQRFNQVWRLRMKSFDELLKPFNPTGGGKYDLRAFKVMFMSDYYKFMTETVRKYDKNHLVMGCRLRWKDSRNREVNQVEGKYVDIICDNYYATQFDRRFLMNAHKWSGGKPRILSEWCYDSRDSGNFGIIITVPDQKSRGKAYQTYVEQAAALPFIVGVQWWCMLDHAHRQTNTGLWSNTDRPYKDFLKYVREGNLDVWKVKLGLKKPYNGKFKCVRRSGKYMGLNWANATVGD